MFRTLRLPWVSCRWWVSNWAAVQDKLSSMLVRWQHNQLVPLWCPNCATMYFYFPLLQYSLELIFCRFVSHILSLGSMATENHCISHLSDRDWPLHSFDIWSWKPVDLQVSNFFPSLYYWWICQHFFSSCPSMWRNRCVSWITQVPPINQKSQVAFLTQATYVYRLRILSQLRYISWSIVVVCISKITHSSNDK